MKSNVTIFVNFVVFVLPFTGEPMRACDVGLVLAGVMGLTAAAGAQTPPQKADIVAVTGCLRASSPNGWTLVNATEPVPSIANAPSAKELASLPRVGKREFQLIGVNEFNLPAHKDHTIVVKGLYIKAEPMSRLNVTSVTMVAPACPPPDLK